MICLHMRLIRISDEAFKASLSYQAGFRYYRCTKCQLILKAKQVVSTA